MSSEPLEEQGPVIRDKRRIDPETGQVREPRSAAAPAPTPGSGAQQQAATVSEVEVALAERTADLQRLQAEYVNYKRRVDRDREVSRQATIASVLSSLLPVLDDVERAREHGELTGGFKAVAESLQRTITSQGLEPFGAVGDEFDPRIHEALMHSYSDDVSGPVCAAVLQVGYRLGDRIVRPARVAVAEPPARVVGSESSGAGTDADLDAAPFDVFDTRADGASSDIDDAGADGGTGGGVKAAEAATSEDAQAEAGADPTAH